jgi:hypothetical protein
VARQNTANDIFIYSDPKRECHLRGDAPTAPTRIALFHRDNRINRFLRGSLRPGFSSVHGGE